MIFCYKKCKGRITSWVNRIMQADSDNIVVKPHPSPISLFVDTSINRPSTSNLMVESDHEDEEDPYSNIALPPTTMDPTVPIVHQPVTVSNSLQRSSSVVMLSDDEQDTDEEQGANQYMQPLALQVPTSVKSTDSSVDNVPSTQANTITPLPSTSNDPQLPQQVPKPQKVKKTLTYISRRFSKRILLKKQKGGDNQAQETVKGKQKKKDLEMQTISKPLTPVAQAVTDRLYNEDKISKGGPVKKSSTKATRGRGRSRKNSSVKKKCCKKIFFDLFYLLSELFTMFFVYPR